MTQAKQPLDERLDLIAKAAPRRGRPPEKLGAQDLRQLILDTSEHLLLTEGLSALSMREVARRAGVTHQAPYHHFPDRESIIAELVTLGFEDLTGRLARANALGAELKNRAAVDRLPGQSRVLQLAGEAYVGFAIDRPGLFRIMFRPELCDVSRFPKAIEAGEQAYGELMKLVVLLHGEGAEVSMTTVYWAQVHGMACLIVDGPVGIQMTTTEEKHAYAHQGLEPFNKAMMALIEASGCS